MNTYKYTVKLSVEIEAFDDGDAWEAVQDVFGVGEDLGVKIIKCEYKEVR